MTDATLPPPLVPAEVDLRDFQGMWIDTDRLLRSDTWVLGTGDEKAAAMTLWLESWHQVPAASLPSHDRMLAKLSQAERWAKSKEHALRGWVACSDGRLYHPVVAEKALEAWIEKLASAINGAVGNAKRWNITVDADPMRAQLRHAADLLRALNASSRTFKKKAVLVILSGSQVESPPDLSPDSPPESPPDASKGSPPDRKGPDLTGPDLTGPPSLPPPEVGAAPPPTRASRGRSTPKAEPHPCPEGVAAQVWTDWLSLRKAKKAPVTPTVVARAREEAGTAGLTLEQFLRVWCMRGSQGLQADWIKPAELQQFRQPAQSFAERDAAAKTARFHEATRGAFAAKPKGESIDMEATDGAPRLLA